MGWVGLKGGVCESGVFEWFLSFSVGRGIFLSFFVLIQTLVFTGLCC